MTKTQKNSLNTPLHLARDFRFLQARLATSSILAKSIWLKPMFRFVKNLSMQGNIRPTSVDIQDIIPVDGNDGNAEYIGYGEVNIQFASPLGVLQSAYAYYGPKELNKNQTVAGWYDEDTEELAEYTFAAEEGFKISAGSAGYLRFPEL